MKTQKIQDQKSLDIESYRQLLDILFSAHQSISVNEANILLRLFSKDSNEQTGNSLTSIIQTIEYSRAQFSEILNNAPSEQLRNELRRRFGALRCGKD